MDFIKRSINITEQQNYELEEWKWKYRMSCSQIIRKILAYYVKNPSKLKELLKNEKINEKQYKKEE